MAEIRVLIWGVRLTIFRQENIQNKMLLGSGQARRQMNWIGGALITSINCCQNCCQIKLRLLHLQRQVWRIIGGHCPPCPPSVYGPGSGRQLANLKNKLLLIDIADVKGYLK